MRNFHPEKRIPKALCDGTFLPTEEEEILSIFRSRWYAHPDDYDPTDEQMRELIAFCLDWART